MESDIVKEQKLYSMVCRSVKYAPRIIVMTNPIWASIHLEFIIDICAQVIVAPLESRTVVFNSGTSKGLRALNPTGGQTVPVSTLGLREEWKKAQKKAKKKQISLEIKRSMPTRIPSSTFLVCLP